MLVTIGAFLVFQGVASTFFVVLSLNVFSFPVCWSWCCIVHGTGFSGQQPPYRAIRLGM